MEQNDLTRTNNQSLIPLADIAKSLGKKPMQLASFAKSGLIRAEKKQNKWYADKKEVEQDLRALTWNRIRVVIKDNLEELINWVIAFIKFSMTLGFFYYLILNFVDSQFSNPIKPEGKLLLAITLTTLVYFYAAFPRALKVVSQAGNVWQRINSLENKTKDLKGRVENLEKSE